MKITPDMFVAVTEEELLDMTNELFPNADSIDIVTFEVTDEGEIKIVDRKPAKRTYSTTIARDGE